jgi:ABC-type transport system involved in multi-copper enzyme maturation permease subunit
MTVFAVARDLLREASSRKWFLGLGIAVTLVLALLAFTLRMDVVDGALAGVRLFGTALDNDIQSVDVALRPVFMAASALVFYGGTLFMVLACADFAPSLLSPGRIEHLLSLPVRRWELLAGTFLGVLGLTVTFALYGAGGLVVLLGVKTGVWTTGPLISALLATVNFATVYAVMITTALFARSAALSAGSGVIVYVVGILAGLRLEIAPLFEEGWGRSLFEGVTRVLPRISTLGKFAIDLAGGRPIDLPVLVSLLAGFAVFGLGVLSVGAWRFEKRDF